MRRREDRVRRLGQDGWGDSISPTLSADAPPDNLQTARALPERGTARDGRGATRCEPDAHPLRGGWDGRISTRL